MGRGRIIILPTPMVRKAAGQMQKLFGLWPNSKTNSIKPKVYDDKMIHRPTIKEGKPSFLVKNLGMSSTFVTRRQIVLNRHFTEIISDVLANNLKLDLVDLGVNITSIETKAWNKGVRIFYSTSKPFKASLHEELNNLVPKLAAAITERRLIGRTPKIDFVYDEAAALEQKLEEVLKVTKAQASSSEREECRLAETSADKQINLSKGFDNKKQSDFISHRFSAPDDMSNLMLGLNYRTLYDEVALKLERGRAQSTRMHSNTTLISSTPIFTGPTEQNTDDEDPAKRILSMQKFLINQRKKNEYLSKKRRQEQLLARDRIKWDLPDDSSYGEDGDIDNFEPYRQH